MIFRPLAQIMGVVFLLCPIAAQAQDGTVAQEIRVLGLEARLDPAQRDAHVQAIAARLGTLAESDQDTLRRTERVFQEALLLVCDKAVFETLSTETIEAVDNALEKLLDLSQIGRSLDWEPLIYVYGFFNHDVTPQEIEAARAGIAAIPEADLHERYVTYPHTVDAVCKPLAMGPLKDEGSSFAAIEAAVPLLKEMTTMAPAPGRAFHPPSHAVLVLPPLYEQWSAASDGAAVRELLGDREAFVKLLSEQLAGGTDKTAFEDFERGFYAYTGRYLANGLARFNGREALPALQRSLAIYRAWGASRATIANTERALVALGDADGRAAFESAGADTATLVWLCRHGQGETVTYAQGLLGKALGVEPEDALDAWFREQLAEARQ